MNRIQQEHARNEQIHKANHNEELKRAQLQAENELKEVIYTCIYIYISKFWFLSALTPLINCQLFIMFQKLTSLRSEYEAQMKALRYQNEDECRKLQEELGLQRTKVLTNSGIYIKYCAHVVINPLINFTGRPTENFIAIAMESNGRQATRGPRSEFKEGNLLSHMQVCTCS